MGYSPTLGRWLEEDPDGFADGLNLCQYVQSNPMSYVDPSGLLHVGTYIEFAGDATWIDKLHHSLPGTGSWFYTTDLESATSWVNREIFLAGNRFRTPLKFDANSPADDKCSYCFDYVTISGHSTSGLIGLGTKKDQNGKQRDVDLTKMSFGMLNKNKALGLQLPEIAFLGAVKAKLCKHATIVFASCDSSTLRRQLSDFFGPGYTLLTYEGKASWGPFGFSGSKQEDFYDDEVHVVR